MKKYTFSEIYVGLRETFEQQISIEMENAFREMSGDNNPLHRDDVYAREISAGKYPVHVSFGMLTASLYSTLAGMYLPGAYSLIHSLENVSFLNPVFVGDVLFVEGEVTDKDESLQLIRVNACIHNQEKRKVSKAKMKIIVLK